MIKHQLEVHKFGGTSLATAQHFRMIESLVQNNAAIVVSAIAGTTNTLQELLNLAKNNTSFMNGLEALKEKQGTLIHELVNNAEVKNGLLHSLETDFQALDNLLQTTHLLNSYSIEMQDKVLGFGELWSAKVLTAFLNESLSAKQNGQGAILLDASKILITYQQDNKRYIDWEKSLELLQQFLFDKDYDHLVITGFIATNEARQFVTLGRNGSDYSAAIFAQLLKASKLVIWSDVDGIFSADPNKVHSAFPLDSLSYEEALELAYFGAKIIHPQTIFPAVNSNIPIYVKNSAKPEAFGTCISADNSKNDYLVRGLTSIEDIALFNIEGSGLSGVSGTAARVFQLLHQSDISVILISQASSEHSICFAIKEEEALRAEKLLTEQFHFEIEQQLVKRIRVDKDCAILAAVGDGMVGRRGVSGKLCNTLARASVNIKAIAQGSSERNLSVVVSRKDINKALRAVHAGFYLSRKTISIGLIGPGQVGKTLLQQIEAAASYLQEKHHVNLRVRGILNSKQMLLDDYQVDLSQWKTKLNQSPIVSNIPEFIDHIAAVDIPHAVIIDCTASQEIAELYPQFLTQGLHIVTPNKRANSSDFDFYRQVHAMAEQMNRFYLYETTVCAGLPVIKTLQDIIATGDEVYHIQGIVSGTLSYIFNALSGGEKFSKIVIQAKEAGYTEPDPRDDLSGKDVARKFVCLARELGFSVTLDDVNVTNLVPPALQEVSLEQFLACLPEHDAFFQNLLNPIFAKQQQPCYVGTISQDGTIQIGIGGFEADHPFSRLRGTDNMLIFTTKRYHPQPLVIQGPGAGTEVTAAGIFSDLLRLVTALD